MKLDVISQKGSDTNPAVVFIHGLGMNKDIWVNPLNSRILGGQFPLKVLLGKMFPGEQTVPQTLYDDLRRKNYSVIAWSQKRPAGPIDSVIPELDEIVKTAREMTKAGIILIGHSRGGLIARKYLMDKKRKIKGLITIATPHGGSSVAGIAKYLSPLISMLNPLLPDGDKGTLSFSIKRIFDFLKSSALKELLPESNFFVKLKDGPSEGIYYASVGGTNPTLFTFRNLSFPDAFERIIPKNLYPEEMKKGEGDGLVSAESAVIPWGEEHHNFNRNHVEILFDEGARDTLVRIIERLSLSYE
jgi:pimeloyl-ACP methyl ester carboxylesterase